MSASPHPFGKVIGHWTEAELRAMKVRQLRAIAAHGMPYRWEANKSQLIEWILRYMPAKRARIVRDAEAAK